jgi:hypothetical protein
MAIRNAKGEGFLPDFHRLTPFNDQIVSKAEKELEKLKEEEETLYKTIKERYPELTDQQIVREIHQHL